jgi:hypothetical protein
MKHIKGNIPYIDMESTRYEFNFKNLAIFTGYNAVTSGYNLLCLVVVVLWFDGCKRTYTFR